MAEEKKKPKIDLKARLGKASAGAPAPSLPGSMPPDSGGAPPSGRPSVPGSGPGIAPPAGIAPPTGIAPPPGIAPPGGMSSFSPFAPKPPPPQPKAAPVSAEAQTIKVEVGEEIHEERRRAGKRAMVYAVIAAVVGIGLGFLTGGMRERSVRSSLAVKGAVDLENDVKTATEKMNELGAILDAAAEQLGQKKYPADLVEKLGGINIPFDAGNLEGKNVGSLPGKTLRQLFTFTRGCQDLNDKKDSLKNLVGTFQKPVESAWAEEKKPLFKLAVMFKGGSDKTQAEMVKLKDPFAVADAWPKELKILVPEMREGKRVEGEKAAARWEKGELTGTNPIVIPIDPSSVSGFTDERVVLQLRKAMVDLKVVLAGDRSDPTRETTGLVKEGENLANALHDIGLKAP